MDLRYDEVILKSDGVLKQYHSSYYGGRFVLTILMKSFSPDDRMSSIMYGDGVKVMIHEKYTYPGFTALEFTAGTGHETIARVYGNRLSSSKEVLNLADHVRSCYASASNTRLYRTDNCYAKCQESIFRKLCNCAPFYASQFEIGEQVCNLTHTSCLARAKSQIYFFTSKDRECDCLPNCEETSYKATITTLPLSMIYYSPNEIYKKASQYSNTIILHIELAGQSALLQRRELMLPKINLISSLGGVFGLLLGCSFVSVIEIFYFFCVYFLYKQWYGFKS